MNKVFSVTLFLFLLAFSACKKSEIENEKLKLFKSIAGLNNELFFNIETFENDSILDITLVNKAIGKRILLGLSDTSLIVGYHLTKSKVNNSSTIFKSELIKKDSIVLVEISNLKGKVSQKFPFPKIEPNIAYERLYSSEEDCKNEYFKSAAYFDVLVLANQTCEPIFFAGPCCHLTDGRFICIDLIVSPTKISCLISNKFINHIPSISILMPSKINNF